jgi:hypothetical protein
MPQCAVIAITGAVPGAFGLGAGADVDVGVVGVACSSAVDGVVGPGDASDFGVGGGTGPILSWMR